jgi:hypothetical protein
MRNFVCIAPFVSPSFPKDHHIEVGEIVELMGYIMGNPVLKFCPTKHPSQYAHLDYCSGMLSEDKLRKHFKEIINTN